MQLQLVPGLSYFTHFLRGMELNVVSLDRTDVGSVKLVGFDISFQFSHSFYKCIVVFSKTTSNGVLMLYERISCSSVEITKHCELITD